MGSSQSKVSAEKAVPPKGGEVGGDYVFVRDGKPAGEKEALDPRPDWRAREPQDISVDQMQEWQTKLLADPKNRRAPRQAPAG